MQSNRRRTALAISPLTLYALGFFLSLAVVTALSYAVYRLYWLPSASPQADFIKDYASGIAAIITLFIGIPIAAASSVAIVMLAAATVEATREAPLYEQMKTALGIVVALHDRWASLVAALNRVDIAVIAVERALRGLSYPDWSDDPNDPGEYRPDWFSMETLTNPIAGLKEAMLDICGQARKTLQDPLVRAELAPRLAGNALLLVAEFPEALDGGGIPALISFLDTAEMEAVRDRFGEISIRLREYIDGELVIGKFDREILRVTIKPGAALAIAGLALWERPEKYEVRDVGSDDTELITTKAEAFPSAAFLHDLLVLLPSPECVSAFMSRHVQNSGLYADPAIIHANANIYAPSLGLNPRLLPAAAEFAAQRLTFKHQQGNKRDR